MPSMHWFRHWDKIFWLFFILMCIAIAIGGVTRLISAEFFVVLGIFMVIMGAGKLASEITHRKVMNYQDDIYKKLHQMSQHIEKTFELASMNKEKNEFRIGKLHQSRKDMDKKIDKNYRDLARKIIETENSVNKLYKMTGNKRK
ncbi:MAG: hypothetical protein V1648_02985 [Candidatus Aenigmatarchaeota archaeon]